MRKKSNAIDRPKLNISYRGHWLAWIGNSPNIYIFWSDPTTKRPDKESTGTADLDEAHAKLIDLVNRKFGPQADKSGDLLLSVILQWYDDTHASKIVTKTGKRKPDVVSGIRKVMAIAGHLSVSELRDKKVVKKIVSELSQGSGRVEAIKLATVDRYLCHLRAAMNLAYKEDVLPSPPPKIPYMDEATIKAQREKSKIFTMTELQDLVRRFRAHEYLFRWVLLMIGTHGRPDACFELQLRQVDFESDLIRLNPPGRVQNRKRRATVKLVPALKPFLQEWAKGMQRTDTFVGVTRRQTAADTWRSVVYGDMDMQGRYTPRSIRRTVASMLIAQGVNKAYVSEQLGHKRADVGDHTDEYIDDDLVEYSPRYMKQSAKGIEKILAQVLAPPADDNVMPFKRAAS